MSVEDRKDKPRAVDRIDVSRSPDIEQILKDLCLICRHSECPFNQPDESTTGVFTHLGRSSGYQQRVDIDGCAAGADSVPRITTVSGSDHKCVVGQVIKG